jgi:N,N'-diacetyllegionaminate synthase
MKEVKINSQTISDRNPTFITFEIGPTHNGVDSAKRLIKYSAEVGANAVKFQIFDPEKIVADKEQLFEYEILKNKKTGEKKIVNEPLYDILKRRCLSLEQWKEIKSYSDEMGIAFFATVGFESDIELLKEIGCDSIKIASADINHFPLIRKAAETGMSIQLDTGMSTIDEVRRAIKVIEETGNERIIIHQCPSGYPAYLESINLNILPILKKEFNYPIAFSDHSPGWDMDIAAVALGVNLIEKTISEDRTYPSVEHIISIEPDEMKEFVNVIRNLEIALGDGIREIGKNELKKRDAIRRSIFTKEMVKKGTLLKNISIEFRRPGFGVQPDEYEELVAKGVAIINNIDKNTVIKKSDLE